MQLGPAPAQLCSKPLHCAQCGTSQADSLACAISLPAGFLEVHAGDAYVFSLQVDLTSGRVRTLAGNGSKGSDYVGGGIGREQQLNSPWDIVLDSQVKALCLQVAAAACIVGELLDLLTELLEADKTSCDASATARLLPGKFLPSEPSTHQVTGKPPIKCLTLDPHSHIATCVPAGGAVVHRSGWSAPNLAA